MNRSDQILGCLIGGAIGDAFGSAFEGRTDVSADELRDAANWHFSDDTQLTLATCEAICEASGPDPERIAAQFVTWFRARRLTGLGASTLKALRDLDAGAHWALAGRKGERGAGNGAAMRVAPLAFCVDPDSDDGRRAIRDVCRITHHNDEACIGALAVVLAIRESTSGGLREGGPALERISAELPDTSVRARLAEYANLPLTASLADAAARFGVSGFVVESVPFAVFAASRARQLGFATMLEHVILAGGDTDTNASLAGQIAGADLGFAALPTDLVTRLPGLDTVRAIATRFAMAVSALK